MVSMKIAPPPPPKAEATSLSPLEAGEVNAYPYGLRIRLDSEELDKLGITTPPAVGSYVSISGRASVLEIREEKRGDGSTERCVELQIEDLEVSGAGGEPDGKPNSMYPSMVE